MLKRAGERLSAPADTLTVNDGIVIARDAPGRISYWELAGEVSLRQDATGSVAAKPAAAHKIVGTPAQRIDIPGKVLGQPMYVHDMRLPGMVFGRVVRPPSDTSQLVSVDEAAVRAMPGVIRVVRDGRFLAVVAEREEQAIDARDALASVARWQVPPDLPDPARVHEHLKGLRGIDTQTVNEKTGAAGAAVRRTPRRTGSPISHTPRSGRPARSRDWSTMCGRYGRTRRAPTLCAAISRKSPVFRRTACA